MADDVSPAAGEARSESPQPAAKPEAAAEGVARRGRRRSAYATRDLTRGSIPRNLWFLGWPQVAEGFLSVADQVADLIWAGRLSYQAIAALGVAQSYLMLTMTARMGMDAGMRSMVARAIGARQPAYANHVVLQSVTLTTLFVAVIITGGILLTEPLLRILGVSDAVMAQAASYLRIQFLAMGLLAYHRLGASALQAAGDSLTPLKAATVTRVLHLLFSPILIFGWIGFPEFGLAGAAVARLGAEWLGVMINFYALFAGTSRLKLSLQGFTIDLPVIWRLVKVGAPASVTNMQRAFSQLIVVGIVAPFGDGALAAFALTRRAENLVNQGSRGLGRAAGALAGQNLGVGLTERAKSTVRWAIIYVGIGSLSITAIFLLFPEAVASFFSDDAEFVAVATRWLIIVAIGYFTMSAVQVFTQAFNTSGDTFAPMVITLATVWLLDVPLAFALSNFTPLGQLGIPWAIVIGTSVRMAAFAAYYLTGRWLRTGVM